ncbi:MAG: SH3 domain-containing protein [Christensenellaceae bacterium]|nr:SH3 domain-containing protein [Christensenellaceae bacterium]
MKKFSYILIICLLISMFIPHAQAQQTGFSVVTGTNSLNLRMGPSSSDLWLGSYSRGTWVKVLGFTNNNWLYVQTPDNKIGYMAGNYLKSGLESCGTMAVVRNPQASAYLNLRQAMSTNSAVLGMLYNGVPLKVLGDYSGWYHVKLNNITGYVMKGYQTTYYGADSSIVATIKTPNRSKLNLRSGPGSQYPTITSYPHDSYVSVLAKGTNWWRVSINGNIGFMSANYLKEGLKAARDIGGSNSQSYVVVNNPRITQVLNLRLYPSMSAQIIGQFRNGAVFDLLQYGIEWCKVKSRVDGRIGYFRTSFLMVYGAENNNPSNIKKIHHPNFSYVNMRSGKGFNYYVITTMPHGSLVELIQYGELWSKIRYNNITGYVSTYFLRNP